jgi:hypothetical protein
VVNELSNRFPDFFAPNHPFFLFDPMMHHLAQQYEQQNFDLHELYVSFVMPTALNPLLMALF